MASEVNRDRYSRLYGPTAGDRVRLGDTGLVIEIERDESAYGDEVLPGCGKTLQSGMAIKGRSDASLDLVITNAIVIDPVLGIFKGNIGVSDGWIVGAGRAGNPDIMDNIDLVIGPHTNVIPAEGLIATAGGVDSHVHLSSPAVLPALIGSGVTTIIGMGVGGVWDIGVNPARSLNLMFDAWSSIPLNVSFLARATYSADSMEEALASGASGFKIHEDFGGTPAVIDRCLTVAEAADVAVAMHTDSLNESGLVADTVDAIAGRAVHAYHVEGSGGGHIPATLSLISQPNIIGSSTTPTIPFGVNAADEIVDMAMIVHRQNPSVETDLAVSRAKVRSRTMEAESHLHDIGAISIINSDSLGMGRGGEVIRRTWQLSHVMAGQFEDAAPHNRRVLRYLAKYTINPAITHGIDNEVGSLEPGKLADIVLWNPALFGTKPEMIVKAGSLTWGAVGDGSGSIRRGQPQLSAELFGAMGQAPTSTATIFVSKPALEAGWHRNSNRRLVAVSGTRKVTRSDMVHNAAVPHVDVPPDDRPVTIDGVPATLQPVAEVPLGRLYHLA